MIPTFDGNEAYGWIIEVEQDCEAMGISEEKKFSEAEKALSCDAFFWWYFWKKQNRKAKWMDFVIALLREFEPDSDPYLPDPVQDTGEEEIPRKQEGLEEEARTVNKTNLEIRRIWCEEWIKFRGHNDERHGEDGIPENAATEEATIVDLKVP